MKRHWLQRNGARHLLIVFGGWGLGPGIFAGMQSRADLLVVEDYRQLDLDPMIAASYEQSSLLGYSFGVASMLHWLHGTGWHPARLVAVNGTAHPASRDMGIAPEIIEATARSLSPASFAGFARRCGHSASLPAIDPDARQQELRAIIQRGSAPERSFDRIWIAERDRIIPPRAQIAAWSAQADAVRFLSAAHQPFAAGQRWEDWLT
ncbi:pimeloyl-ACP methyl esterase BioG family protein [Paracoccus methylarcula]|uniref:DUF452 domain-containing protein n=1 Tax=Paracoccus methylarcula TaxID=72022 RepID=A0A3R7P6D3_9RHOB|nr:pimeloyl-ACP methyl esterase BioG family protein [Paracoccus methylarcula]RNF36016.1 DUF452 domain-containing protein [Paracoccus methylarcula]